MSAHEWFEELSALGVTGDLEPEEFRQLGEHLYECASCRALYRDFHAMIECGLPTLQLPSPRRLSFRYFGMKRRFLKRARKEGIPIENSKTGTTLTFRILATAIAVSLVFVLADYGWHAYRLEQYRYTETANRTAALSDKVAQLEQQLSQRAERAASQPVPTAEQVGEVKTKFPPLEIEFAKLRNDYESILTRREQLEQRVSELVTESEKLRGESQASREEIVRLQRNLRETEVTLSQTIRDLESARNAHSTDTSTIVSQRAQIDRLTATVREQSDAMQRERD